MKFLLGINTLWYKLCQISSVTCLPLVRWVLSLHLLPIPASTPNRLYFLLGLCSLVTYWLPCVCSVSYVPCFPFHFLKMNKVSASLCASGCLFELKAMAFQPSLTSYCSKKYILCSDPVHTYILLNMYLKQQFQEIFLWLLGSYTLTFISLSCFTLKILVITHDIARPNG